MGWAYFYLLVLGWLGVHRFYLQRWYSGLLYAMTFGFLGIGLVVDLFVIPGLTRTTNARLDELARQDPRRFRVLPERIAPWAGSQAGRFGVDVVLVGIFWVFAAPLLAILAIMFGFNWGPAYLAIMLVIVAFVGSTYHFVERYPNLVKVPLVSTVLDHLTELEQYYFDNRPRPLVYYLAFPITAPIAAIFSPKARTEARILLWPIGVVMFGLAADFAWSFSDHFKDSVNAAGAFGWLVAVAFVSGMVVLMFLLPTVTTALALNLSGRRRFTRIFAALGILVGIPFTAVAYHMFSNRLTIPAAELVEERFKNKAFRQTVTRLGKMYLSVNRPEEPVPAGHPPGLEAAEDEELSEELQTIMEGFVPDSEVGAFRVWRVKSNEGAILTAIQYSIEGETADEVPDPDDVCHQQPIIVSDHQRIYTKADDLANVIDLSVLAHEFGQGEQTYLIEDWPCGANVDPAEHGLVDETES